jgi:hypothetical protein
MKNIKKYMTAEDKLTKMKWYVVRTQNQRKKKISIREDNSKKEK